MNAKNKIFRLALAKHGLTQWEAAEALGIGESTLSRMLRRELPKAEQREMVKGLEAYVKQKQRNG